MLHRTMSSGPQIKVHPDGHLLVDDKLEIKVTGLPQHQKTTLHAVITEGGNVFESCSCYTADDNGEVNLATQPSIAGSYTGVSPMGIFWSMVQAPGQKDGLRLMKKDMDTPMIANISLYNSHVSADAIHKTHLNPMCTTTIERWYKAPGVKTEVIRDGRLRGVLYLPPGDRPFPGVIDLFGTVGGLFEFRSALLASRGFASFSLPYFAFEDLPKTLEDVDFDYFLEAIDWLCSHRDVFHDGIGVVGVSRGGDLSLLMAAHSKKVSCVADINGCTFNQTYGLKFKDGFIPAVPIQLDKMYEEDGAFVCKECWPHTKEDLIPVWSNDAKILALVGLDDKLNPWQCNQLMKDNLPPEKSDNFHIVTYEGAGHLIEPPYTPLCEMSYHKSYKHRKIQCAPDSMPRILVHPDGHLLMDDKLEIKIVGLNKRQAVTLHAFIKESSSVFESCCGFTSDENGEVNLATQPSIAGSYTGVSPMGIFWSMVQAPGQRDGLRLIKKDVTTPMTTNIAVYNDHLSVDTIHSATPESLCSGSIDRWYMGDGVKRVVVKHDRLRGVLYLPSGKGPFPGAIDMFGGAGGIIEFRAALLASRGFACFSLPYFMYEDLPDNMFDLKLDYFLEAIHWMCSHRDVYHDGIGVLGVSKGGDIALAMATYSEKVTCVVNINGLMFLASYGLHYKDGYIPPVLWKMDALYKEDGAYVSRDCWDYTKDDIMPVWKNDAKILNILGEDDLCSPWENIVFAKDCFPPEKRDNFEIVSYSNTGHLIEPPYTPLCRMSYNKGPGIMFWWGGYPEPHAAAQEDSWQRILDHLNRYIPLTSTSDLHVASKL